MQKYKSSKECCDFCLANGMFEKRESINTQRIKSMIENAQTNMSQANIIAKCIKKNAREWMGVYTNYYEAIRTYAEALVMFEKISVTNHQCLFAYICQNYPVLEFDWEFLEAMRYKRNGVHYYGEHITYSDWKSIEVKVKLHLMVLERELIARLKK